MIVGESKENEMIALSESDWKTLDSPQLSDESFQGIILQYVNNWSSKLRESC